MKKIYISGRISGLPYTEAVERFTAAKAFLETLGYEALNPTDNGIDPESSWNDHMVADIRMLLEADSVFMLPDWRDSKGARIEHNIALELQKPIHYCEIE